jgi:hypothetical protein
MQPTWSLITTIAWHQQGPYWTEVVRSKIRLRKWKGSFHELLYRENGTKIHTVAEHTHPALLPYFFFASSTAPDMIRFLMFFKYCLRTRPSGTPVPRLKNPKGECEWCFLKCWIIFGDVFNHILHHDWEHFGGKPVGFVAIGSPLVVATPSVIAKSSDSISCTGTGGSTWISWSTVREEPEGDGLSGGALAQWKWYPQFKLFLSHSMPQFREKKDFIGFQAKKLCCIVMWDSNQLR